MKIKPTLEQNPGRHNILRHWQRRSATALLLCAAAVLTPSFAAPPANPPANEAVLNFVGADIESVVKAVGHYTNITFVIDPRVKGTINLVSEKPVTKAQAFALLSSALRLQGFAVVTTDGVTKVVPEADAKLQAAPTQVGGAAALKGDQIATQIYRLNYESSTNLLTVLRPLISPNNTINANPGNNTLIITDYADNLKRLGKIIAALDAPASGDLDVVPIRYAVASDIAVMANKLLEPGSGVPGAADAGRISLLADPRTNSVIVRAPSLARANLAKTLIAKLDQPTIQPGNVHVVYLKNAEAVKLAQTLRSVVSSDGTAPAATPALSTPSPASTGAMQGGAPSAPSTTPTSLPSGGAAGFIQADASTNTLIITASEPVYRNLRTVIDMLDVRRAQVYIESMIAEVSADVAAEFGIQWLGLSGDAGSNYRVGGGTSFSAGGNNIVKLATQTSAAPVPPGNGLTIGIFRQIGGKLGLGAVAHALETNGNSNILSTPNLITLDNEEAKIIVGQNVPFITGQFTTPGSVGASPFQTVERKDVGLSLRVRPQVSEGGTIKMAIYQEKSSVDSSVNNSAGIITNKSSIETNVLADDGQIIVLGGMVADKVEDGVEKVRGLGDIPIIGNLFKYQTRNRKKSTLMVFLRPVVIRSTEQSSSLVTDRYDYVRGTETASQPEKTILLPDTGAPVLPPLQNGQPVGGTLVKPIPPSLDSMMRPAVPVNGSGDTAQPTSPPPLQAPTQSTTPK